MFSSTTEFAISKILVPIDFDDLSQVAFDSAKSIAAKFGAEIVALHVARVPPEYGEWAVEPPTDAQFLREEADKLARFSCEGGVRIEHVTLPGDAASRILELAADRGCDLIVMGTAGRRGLSRFILGSVAEMVSRMAPCPVLLVKARGARASEPQDKIKRAAALR